MSLTAALNTPFRDADVISVPVAATTHLFPGGLAGVNSSGYAVPASDTAGIKVLGRIEAEADNSSGNAGDIAVTIRRGCFKYANSVSNAVAATAVGKVAVVEDDATVASTSTNKVVAGRVMGVESDGVWIDTRYKTAAAQAATSVGAAVASTASTNSSPYGYSQAQADALVARVNELRTAVLELQGLVNG